MESGCVNPVFNGTANNKVHSEIPTDVERSVFDLVEPVTLSWTNVNVYTMPEKRWCCGKGQTNEEPKHIINNVSGLAKPGSLVAIMGASGAGKSTLMNTLTFRNRGKLVIQGDVRVNGIVADKTKISNISAYVQQEDLFIGTLTVREHLTFRAVLRMDKRKTRRERLKRVEDVIKELGLTKCADTIIGTPGRIKGISGGEMKRLSFASESLTNPALMFCDEATSGLDSFMAMSVVQSLKKMVSRGHTILCTIHQPSSEIYEMFDHVLLLAEGRLAFMGSARETLEFFERNGFPCPNNYNPADHYILTLAIMPGSVTECKERVQKICDSFEKSQSFKSIEEEIKTICGKRPVSQSFVEDTLSDTSRYGASYFQQIRSVFWRSWLTAVRDPVVVKIKFMQVVFFAVVLGLIYLKTNDDYTQQDIQNINGIIFIIILNTTFTNTLSVLNIFPVEVPVFLREYGTGLYRVDVYYLCKTFVEIPFLIIIPIIYMSVLYWMSGLVHDFEKFCIATGIAVLVANISASFGYTISAAVPTVTAALSIAPPILIPFVLFGGLFLNAGSFPDYLIWLQYISWFSYSNEILIVNQWKDVTSIGCPANSTSCIQNGQSVIANLNFSEDNVYMNLGLLFALIVGFRIFSFIILFIRARRSST